MTVRVVTDSACSIDAVEAERLRLSVVPLSIMADGRPLTETELASPGLYARLAQEGAAVTTSQPAPDTFAAVFRGLAEAGHDVLAVLISGGMSGTVASAEAAAGSARMPGRTLSVLDSRSNSLEEGFAVMSAAEAALAGASLEACRAAARETMRRTRFLFTPYSLEPLRRGGRISRAGALVGVMLKVVPVLTAQDGTTGVAGVVRGSRAAVAKIATLLRADVEKHGLRRVAVQYVADEEGARRFAAEVVEPIAGRPVPVVPIPPIVGVHVGPAIGVVYETERPLR